MERPEPSLNRRLLCRQVLVPRKLEVESALLFAAGRMGQLPAHDVPVVASAAAALPTAPRAQMCDGEPLAAARVSGTSRPQEGPCRGLCLHRFDSVGQMTSSVSLTVSRVVLEPKKHGPAVGDLAAGLATAPLETGLPISASPAPLPSGIGLLVALRRLTADGPLRPPMLLEKGPKGPGPEAVDSGAGFGHPPCGDFPCGGPGPPSGQPSPWSDAVPKLFGPNPSEQSAARYPSLPSDLIASYSDLASPSAFAEVGVALGLGTWKASSDLLVPSALDCLS